MLNRLFIFKDPHQRCHTHMYEIYTRDIIDTGKCMHGMGNVGNTCMHEWKCMESPTAQTDYCLCSWRLKHSWRRPTVSLVVWTREDGEANGALDNSLMSIPLDTCPTVTSLVGT